MRSRRFVYTILSLLSLSLLSGCGNDKNGIKVIIPSKTVSCSFNGQTVIYEANPRVFAATSSLNAIASRLDEIKSLGTDILWLMPVYEQGKKDAFGSPYCIRDFKSVNSDYGTLDDLKNLVSKAHSKGMKVILDMVANHTSWDNGWITAHPEWYKQDVSGKIVSPSGWNDVAQLDYSKTGLRSAMTDVFEYWIKAADVDGYRCDYVEGVPHDFWKTLITSLSALKGKDLFMLAESNRKEYYSDGFDATYCWNMPDWMQSAVSSSSFMSQVDKYESDCADVPAGKYRMRFTTNHDRASEKSPVEVFKNKDAAFASFAVTAALSDCVLIYSSQEVGYPDALSFFKTVQMDWNAGSAYSQKYGDFISALKSVSGLRGDMVKFYDIKNTACMYFSGGLLAVVNLSGTRQEITFPSELASREAKDAISGKTLRLKDKLSLEPYDFAILSTR